MASEWSPLIISAAFTPNPAIAGGDVLLQVVVIDVQSIEQEELRMAGEFMSGEV